MTALGYIERIETFLQGMRFAFERGTRRDDIRPGLRTFGLERRITVGFTLEAESVVARRLFHAGRNWEGAME